MPLTQDRLTRKLWFGALALDAIMLAVVALYWPDMIRYMAAGVVLGLIYLSSLAFNGSHPLAKIQFAFSLIRMTLFAYLIVWASNHEPRAMALVMCGFLSYKVILTLEYVKQALPVFRHSGLKRPSGRAEDNPRAV